MKWVQIHLWFDYKKHPELFTVEDFIRKIFVKYSDKIFRKYYLFEPNPHLFIALEIMQEIDIKGLDRFVNKIKPKFIKKVKIVFNTTDYANGNTFIDVMDAMTRFNVFRLSTCKRYGKVMFNTQYMAHIFHCVLNMYYGNKEKEIQFYRSMIKLYE